jgi:glycosyltransferase involved in cell wall biosynthesis
MTLISRSRRSRRFWKRRDLRIGVVSYDLRFFTPILDHLEATDGVEVRVDRWRSLHAHNGDATDALMDWADVIISEWCGPYAALASRRLRPDQRLIIRLHRFELHDGYCAEVDIDNTEAVVTVDPHYRELVLGATGWPEGKVRCIPNLIDTKRFALPKTPEARFRIGMLGANSSRKRLDLALDVIEEVRAEDPRFRLLVKSTRPQETRWVWSDPTERAYFERVLSRVETLQAAGALEWSEYGEDVPAWLQNVGFVLSTSDDESFHMAPAEGMASGAVPVVRAWPGAATVYDRRWVHETTADMARAILTLAAEPDAWDRAAEQGRSEVIERYDEAVVLPMWSGLIFGDAAVS